MSASFFCTIPLLKQDLQRLAYPDVENADLFNTDSEARICLLEWLASEMNPTLRIEGGDIRSLATFYDSFGIHTATEPNVNGFYIPLTCADRPRDKAAAFVFLRSAIDIVLAFRRIRSDGLPNWAPGHNDNRLTQTSQMVKRQGLQQSVVGEDSDDDEIEVEFNEFDCIALDQMNKLIRNRHKLFPNAKPVQNSQQSITQKKKRQPLAQKSTNSLNNKSNIISGSPSHSSASYAFSPTPSRKRPPSSANSPKTIYGTARRPATTNVKKTPGYIQQQTNKPAHTPILSSKTPNSKTKPTTKRPGVFHTSAPTPTPRKKTTNNTRESIIERLRTLRRETTDFSASTLKLKPSSQIHEEEEEAEAIDINDDEIGKELAENATILKKLMKQFSNIVDEAHSIRKAKGRRTVKRDLSMESSLSELTPSCKHLAVSVTNTIEDSVRVRDSVDGLYKGGQLLELLSSSNAIRSVVRQQHRTECHI